MERFDDKNLLCDVFDAYFYDSKDNLVFVSENLTASDIKGSADEKEVRNGKGNGLFAKLYSNKKIDISLKTNAFDFSTVAMLAGTEVGTGNGTCFTPSLLLTVESMKIVLPQVPKYPERLEMYLAGGKIKDTDYTLTDNVLEFTATAQDGDELKFMPYEFEMPANSSDYKEITIGANDFPAAGKLVLKGIEKNKLTQVYKDLTIIIPQAQPASDFSFSTSSQVEATETEIKLSALVDNGRLMKVLETPHIEQNNGVFTPVGGTTVTPIANLAGTSTNAGEVDLTFTAIGVGATAKLQYKEAIVGSTYADVTVGGSTGVYMLAAISETDTNVTVDGLTTGKDYTFRLVVTGGTHAGNSNITTVTVA